MKISTKRMEIRPLNSEMLEHYALSPKRLQAMLGITEPLQPLDAHMQKVYQLKAKRISQDPSALLFHTYYLLILNESNDQRQLVGFLGLKGEPDDTGAVEVGYHIFSSFRNKGYMKEALSAYCEWLLQLKEVSCVLAYTSKENIPSQHVLATCGFEMINKHKDMIVWSFTAI